MESTFKALEADKHVAINGTHWAALINAYGCAKKDLDKAISIFESIAFHPSSAAAQLPNAICFEALFNVLVTLRRSDLIPEYLGRLKKSGKIHMTAYIANLVIKGYSSSSNIDQARDVFESLADPPEGIAAPNNRAAHDSTPDSVPANAPVYREVRIPLAHSCICGSSERPGQPSTWETMIRAELGCGNRDRAIALLERLKARYVILCCFLVEFSLTKSLLGGSRQRYTPESVASLVQIRLSSGTLQVLQRQFNPLYQVIERSLSLRMVMKPQ